MLAVSVLGLMFGCWAALKNQIPDQMYVTAAGEVPYLFEKPFGWMVSEQVLEEPDWKKESGESRTGQGAALQSSSVRETEKTNGADVKAADLLHSDTKLKTEEASKIFTSGQYAGSRVSSGLLEHVDSSYEVEYSLFGKIPLKTASVSVVSRKSVYAGGTPIGIYMETNGVMVVDTDHVTAVDGRDYEPAANILKSGDYIQAADGVPLDNKEELIACMNQSEGKDVVLDITRDGEAIRLKVTPVQTGENTYKAGVWVRNDTQGIGTLTYVEESGKFGALGHGISDVDTGELLQIRKGILYDTDVVSVIKGTQGVPGELAGVIHYSDGYVIGDIEKNQENGIYGQISGFPYLAEELQKYEVAYKQEVETGPATILCSIGEECREYKIEIQELRLNGKDVNKGMVLKVNDEELLELTGGIVQGMSGSPILQNGRIVGAVTHVFVNDPTKGYGIFIENMLEN